MEKMLEQDPQLMEFVQKMEQEQRLKKKAEELTVECWDLCVTNPSVAKFDYKTEQCLMNCVNRFIDSSTYLLQQFGNKAASMANESRHLEDSGMSFDDSYSSTKKEEKKSSWW